MWPHCGDACQGNDDGGCDALPADRRRHSGAGHADPAGAALTQAQQSTAEDQDWGDEPPGAAPCHGTGAAVMGLARSVERCAASAVDGELLPSLLLPTPSPSQ